jgi:hypothetical protein
MSWTINIWTIVNDDLKWYLFYKLVIAFINYATRVTLQIVALLTIITYNRNTFLVHATRKRERERERQKRWHCRFAALFFILISSRTITKNDFFAAKVSKFNFLFSFCPTHIYQTRRKHFNQGILKGEVSLYHWPPVWLVWISLFCK